MNKFTITIYRQPWNNTAKDALRIAQLIEKNPDLYEVSTCSEFVEELRVRLETTCDLNKIDISRKNEEIIWINRPNSTEAAAITIRLNHIGHIVYGPWHPDAVALNIALSRGFEKYVHIPADGFDIDRLNTFPDFFTHAPCIIITECPADLPAQLVEHIKAGKYLFIFMCKDKPEVPPGSPFTFHPTYERRS